MMKCEACGEVCKNARALSTHIQHVHKMTGREYTIEYLHGGVEPRCAECGGEVRYVSFEFKQYCKEHAKLAMSRGGKKGGKAEAWNKGLTKETDERLMAYSEMYSGEGNPFYGKRHSEETKAKLRGESRLSEFEFNERLAHRCSLNGDSVGPHHEFICHTAYEEYESRQHQMLSLTCVTCGEICEKNLQAVENGSLCYTCHPISKYSQAEKEIAEFIESLGITAAQIVRNTRQVITPKEIDIYIPDKPFAMEHNGLYWHDAERVGREHHELKMQMCKDLNLPLFQIWSDEWTEKPEIVKSMIRHRLGLTENRRMARKMPVEQMSTDRQRQFFNDNHLSGYVRAKIAWCLYGTCAISLREPLNRGTSSAKTIEVARYCTKKGYSVAGGLARLFSRAKTWALENGYDEIITYVDLMHGDGHGYEALGFKYVGTTRNFWYTDGVHRFNRFKFRARDGMSEKDVAAMNKVWRVYGAGTAKFRMKLSA